MGAGYDRWKKRRTERELAEKMNAAYNRYSAAQAEFARLNEQSVTGLGNDSKVISHRMRAVLQRQKDALREYQEALKKFTDFVINWGMPDSPPEDEES